jgi:hypothetical protein
MLVWAEVIVKQSKPIHILYVKSVQEDVDDIATIANVAEDI